MRLIATLLLASALLAAETPKPDAPKPTFEQQLAAKDAEIQWLRRKLEVLQAKFDGLSQYFTADAALRQLDAQQPAQPDKPSAPR